MQFVAYLTFNGQCAEAFKFYERCFGGKILSMFPHRGSPAEGHVPPESLDKIMHARLAVGDALLMGSDALGSAEHPYQAPKGMSVAVQLKDPAQGERIFSALSEGGTVAMPFQKTFWSAGFEMLVDKYGIPWMVNCEGESTA